MMLGNILTKMLRSILMTMLGNIPTKMLSSILTMMLGSILTQPPVLNGEKNLQRVSMILCSVLIMMLGNIPKCHITLWPQC